MQDTWKMCPPQCPPNMQTDFGPNPFVVDINKATLNNDNYRTAVWTGRNIQLTTMNIPVCGDVGLEMHPHVDQFLRVEDGNGLVLMGDAEDNLTFRQPVYDNDAIFVPAGTWHNLVNVGNKPLKLYSVYGPPNHAWGTVHPTKEIAEQMEHA